MSALVLAVDTSTEQVAIGLGSRDGCAVSPVASIDFEASRRALTELLPAVQTLLSANGHHPRDLAGVVVGRGPGSFTGVRIGVASAKGLAHGLGVPLWGVGTLDAVAWRSSAHEGLLGVLGDAMRKEVYPALFRCEGGRVTRLAADTVAHPHDVAEEWAALDEPVLVVGNGLAKYRELFDRPGSGLTVGDPALWAPTGLGLLAAYEAALTDGSLGDGSVGGLLPIYTRLSDAEENERIRLGREESVPSSGVDGPEDAR